MWSTKHVNYYDFHILKKNTDSLNVTCGFTKTLVDS